METDRDPRWAWLRSPTVRALAALLFVLALGAVFNADGAFFKWHTHRDMFRHVAVYGMLACGLTLVIVAGGIDLSVGSLLGVSSVLFALTVIRWGWDPWLAAGVVLAAGALAGLVSGVLIAGFRMQPFIATLATMVAARGLAKWVSGGQKISTAVQQADGTYHYVGVPPAFTWISSKLFHENIAVVTLIFMACVALCGLLLDRLRWGRYLYAIGGNEEAARLSGIPVATMKAATYALCGLFSAAAGLCQAAQEQQGDPEAGVSYELTAIAMVVIGGTSLAGGRGGIGLTLLGVLTIGYLEKILSVNAVSEALRLMLTGLIIVGAVWFQRSKKGDQ